jgi:hypothetical protein
MNYRRWRKPGSAVDPAACAGRGLADYLTRLDFVVLDELGYLPFTHHCHY